MERLFKLDHSKWKVADGIRVIKKHDLEKLIQASEIIDASQKEAAKIKEQAKIDYQKRFEEGLLQGQEEGKLDYGTAWLFGGEDREEVIIPGIGNLPPEQSNREVLSEIIQARLEEILNMAREAVIKGSNLKHLNGSIILKYEVDTLLQNLHTRHTHDGVVEQYGDDDTGEQQKP